VRLERAVPWVGGALLAAPVLFFHYPPMHDLPLHEGLVTLLVRTPGIYARSFGHPNQLFYFLAWPLAKIFAVHVAVRGVAALSILLVIAGAGQLARHMGRSPWHALYAAPLALGHFFFWGLATNLLGAAALFFALPVLDRLYQRTSAGRMAGAIAMVPLLYFAHEAALVMYGVAGLILGLRRRVCLIPLLLATALVLVEIKLAVKPPSVASVPDAWMPLGRRFVHLPFVLVGPRDDHACLAVTFLCLLAVARPKLDRFTVVGAALLILYFTAPTQLNGATMVHVRFLPVAYVLLARGGRVLSSAVAAAMLALALPAFPDASRTNRDLEALLPHVAEGSAVAQLDIDGPDRHRDYLPDGVSARLIARAERLSIDFTRSPNAPVVMRPEARWDEPELRLLADPLDFRPAHDFRHFRYAVAHAGHEGNVAALLRSMEPEGKLVARSGEWLLFESTLPLRPFDPLPTGETLRDRFLTRRRTP
jgi:hypothetical protein